MLQPLSFYISFIFHTTENNGDISLHQKQLSVKTIPLSFNLEAVSCQAIFHPTKAWLCPGALRTLLPFDKWTNEALNVLRQLELIRSSSWFIFFVNYERKYYCLDKVCIMTGSCLIFCAGAHKYHICLVNIALPL